MIVTARSSEAGKLFLVGQNLSTVSNIYSELEDADVDPTTSKVRSMPCVGFFGTDAVEFPPRSGNYKLNLHCVIAASFDDCDAASFDAMCLEVIGKIHTDSIHVDLTGAIDDFTCIALAGAVTQTPSIDTEHRLRRMDVVLPLYACCSDLEA
jgi:hypothetical protein